jgi:hypothetical protein
MEDGTCYPLADASQPDEQVTGTVEIDAIAVAGDPKKRSIRRYGAAGRHIYNPPGRGSEAPTTIVAIEKTPTHTDGPTRAGRARVAPTDSSSSAEIGPILANGIGIREFVTADGVRLSTPPAFSVRRRRAAHSETTRGRRGTPVS